MEQKDTRANQKTSTGLQDMRQLESRFLWLSNAGLKTHNGLYATSIRTTREGEIYPIPKRFYRGVRFKERGTPRCVHKGDKHGYVQTVVVSSTSSRAVTSAWASCQWEMIHGTEQHHKMRAPTPVFTIYTTLLQSTKNRRWQRPFAAKC